MSESKIKSQLTDAQKVELFDKYYPMAFNALTDALNMGGCSLVDGPISQEQEYNWVETLFCHLCDDQVMTDVVDNIYTIAGMDPDVYGWGFIDEDE